MFQCFLYKLPILSAHVRLDQWNGDEKRKQSKANVERVRLEVV